MPDLFLTTNETFSNPSIYHLFSFEGYPPGEGKKKNSNIQFTEILAQDANENIAGKSPDKTYLLTFSGILLIVMVLVTAVILIYKKIQKFDSTDDLISSDGRISIAVMPFQNMTNSPEAYRSFISGRKAFYERDNLNAIKYYSQALAYDSNFLEAAIRITLAYANEVKNEQHSSRNLMISRQQFILI